MDQIKVLFSPPFCHNQKVIKIKNSKNIHILKIQKKTELQNKKTTRIFFLEIKSKSNEKQGKTEDS